MKVMKRDTAFEGDYLRVVNKHTMAENGHVTIWETIERTNVYNRGVVVIIALTRDGEIILERNWRAAIESYVIQFPAGLCDIEGETAEETARRELFEETGYVARELIPIVTLPMSPVLVSTEGDHFLAPDVVFDGTNEKDMSEEIEVLKVPVNRLEELLLNPPNETTVDLRVPGIIWILEKRGLI